MSESYEIANRSREKTTDYVAQIRIFLAAHPEWWTWLVSASVWGILIVYTYFSADHFAASSQPKNIILCLSSGQYGGETFSSAAEVTQTSVQDSIYATIFSGMIPWALMVFAMMFPLLKYPIRHVAFSVRQRNRTQAIGIFLLGYTFIWSICGIFFRLIPEFSGNISTGSSLNVQNLAAGLIFLLAAIVSWLPSRKITMMKCDITLPIRLNGWSLFKDSIVYGIKIGTNCIRMCWIPMIGLMLVHHSALWMLAVSLTVVIERYFVPPGSKSIGYVWALLGGIVLGSGIMH
ncbi:DUF2182 domain-containing protein [Fluviicola sp.]|uniref:copper chaperone n=1 Tax=Fluviicola sp. TaxID=1917219 RepID=UPI0031D65641